jgi:hypothetical protein
MKMQVLLTLDKPMLNTDNYDSLKLGGGQAYSQ